MTNQRRISPHFLAPRLQDRELAATLSFPEFDKSEEKAVPEVKDAVVVRVDVPSQEDREILLGQRFEIIIFLSRAVESRLAFSDSMQIPVREGVETPPHVPAYAAIRAMQVDYRAIADNLERAARFNRELFRR